jgi:hypothetical protein
MLVNPELLRLAAWRLENPDGVKEAFVPPGAMDPAAGGGAPPGAPPMDPSMAGGAPPGAPPMDPSMMGGAPPMAAPAAAPAAPAVAGKPAKADINTVAMDIFQVKKLVMHFYRTVTDALGIPFNLPQDIIDGPNRDPATGASVAPGTPGSTSDPNQAPPSQAQQAPPPNAIPPIAPVDPATMNAPPPDAGAKQGYVDQGLYLGGGVEMAPMPQAFDTSIISRASAISAIMRRLHTKNGA